MVPKSKKREYFRNACHFTQPSTVASVKFVNALEGNSTQLPSPSSDKTWFAPEGLVDALTVDVLLVAARGPLGATASTGTTGAATARGKASRTMRASPISFPSWWAGPASLIIPLVAFSKFHRLT